MEDVRLEWIKDITYRFLSIEINDNAFEDLLNRDNNLDILKNVLDGLEDAEKCFFIYKEIVEEEIETGVLEPEIEKPEENSKAETSRSSLSVKSDSEEDHAEDEEKEVADSNEPQSEEESIGDDENKEGKSEKDDAKETEKKSTEACVNFSNGPVPTSLMLIVKKVRLNMLLNITEHVPSRTYACFLVIKAEPIPEIKTFEEAVGLMPGYFEVSCLNQHPVVCLDKLITRLYVPMFGDEAYVSNFSSNDYSVNSDQLCLLFGELSKEMKEFADSTNPIISQIEKPFMFTLIDIPLETSTEELAREGDFVNDAEEIMKEWKAVILKLYKNVSEKKPPDTGILHETRFWKEQKLKLSNCCDQLSHNSVQKILEILTKAGSNLTEFQIAVGKIEEELAKVTDNVNYLSLMEHNLKSLRSGGTYAASVESIQQIFMVMKIIWVQSEYYKNEANMCRLLHGIALLLKNRVQKDTELDILFRKPLTEIRIIVKESIDILKFWKELYLTESEKVKKFGGSFWWGFDIRLFFHETDYIISVCWDLEKISEALQQLYNIFNTNLRFFVENVHDLDILENRIFGMTALIQYADFNILNPTHKTDWDRIMFVFFRDVKCYEEEMKTFIGKMFQLNLRWQDAYNFSRSFEKITVSPAIKQFIGKCRVDMLKQYAREIIETENTFLALERDPPQFEGIPPYTSAILWVRDLRQRISSPMAQICDNTELSDKDREVMKRFKRAEGMLNKYEKEKYEAWKSKVNDRLNRFLQAPVLKKLQITSSEDTKRIEEALSYHVNFPIEMEEVSVEAKLLEEMGYEIPTFVKNVVLQEASFYKHRNKLKSILEDLKMSLSQLSIEEVAIMGMPIKNLSSVLDLGVTLLQWETPDIHGFLIKCKQAVDIFRGLLSQIEIIVREIDKQILLLADCDLFDFTKTGKDTIPTCEEFFGYAATKLEDKAENLVWIYSDLEPLLIKLEQVACKTSTGKSEQMRKYYTSLEERILNSLIKMMLANLEYFKDEVLENFIFPYTKAASECPDELIASSVLRLKLLFVTFMKKAIETTRKLTRWLDGSCIESSPFYVEETKSYAEFSYYLDLTLHPKVKALTLSIINTFFVYVDSVNNKKI